MSEDGKSVEVNYGKRPIPRNVHDVHNTVVAILVDYSDRKAAYQAAYSWLHEIPRELANEWLKIRKISSAEQLKKKLAYLQTKYRRTILAQRKRESDEFKAEFEKWLWENDPVTAAHRMLDKFCNGSKNKIQPK